LRATLTFIAPTKSTPADPYNFPCEAMRPEGRVTAYAPGDAHRRFHLGDQYNQWAAEGLVTK